ncbi:SusC/RagA family TonB-linked outer membrane protein [Bacteroidia bacterium]|nr:SusC/RagA family TonB-linked outer membrane protein [Bacteroidia bacterium]
MKKVLIAAMMLLVSFAMMAQNRTLTGRVVSAEDNQGVPFANVSVKGTTIGVTTDFEGNFSISVAQNATTLVFSFMGFTTKEVEIGGQTSFQVVLESAATDLDEVVVIGYGTQKKRDLTGAVSSVSAKELVAVPVANVGEALAGKMAGVQVSATEGSPDAEITIRVRGGGSITGNNTPLYIVDGFPVNSISDIASGDIQSIDVLKDASSTAIYGARGANGVIIITTKSGEAGKLTVNYNAYVGVKKIAKKLGVLNPYDYALWQYERGLLSSSDKTNPSDYTKYFGNWEDIDMYQGMVGNDWQDITFGRTGFNFNQNLSVNGGTEKLKYAFSYNHNEEKAIMVGSDFSRDNLSLKLTNNPNKYVQLDFSARWSQTQIDGAGTNAGGDEKGSTSDTRLKYAMIYPGIPMSSDLSDPTNTDQNFNLYSPLIALRDANRAQTRNGLNLNGALSWKVYEGIKLRSEVGLDQYKMRDDRFYGVTTYYVRNNVPAEMQMHPAIIFVNNTRQTLRNTNTVNIDLKKYLPKEHSLNILLGHEVMITNNERLTSEVAGFDNSYSFEKARALSSQGTALATENYYSPDDKLLSFFGRLNYDFSGKYLFSATFRRDGSSKFSDGHRWGNFPSVSAAWRLSAEPFLKSTEKWLYDLKLRASYGTAGNNNIPSGQMVQTYNSGTASNWLNTGNSVWNPSKTMANPNLTWETTITRNIGLDWSLFKGKLGGTIETYWNTTNDLLVLFPTPGTGYDNQYRNMGSTQNQGVEFNLNYTAIQKKNYGLSINFNIGFNKNKILSLGEMQDFMGATEWASTEIGNEFIVAVGGAVGQMIGYRSDGRYEVSDFEGYNAATGLWTLKGDVVDCSPVIGTIRPGSMKLKDLDGDGKVTEDFKDREIIGNANPVHTGGFNINANAYGFDLGLNFNWAYGNDVYNANKIEYTSTSKYHSRNMIDIMESGERWTNLDLSTGMLVNDPDQLAAMNENTTMWSPYMKRFVFSDWAVEDGSFLRLNTVTLGYTVPKKLVNKIKIENLRIYCSAYNVALWTNYSGFDPEVSTRRKLAYTPGVDYAAYPRSRSIVFGVNLTF